MLKIFVESHVLENCEIDTKDTILALVVSAQSQLTATGQMTFKKQGHPMIIYDGHTMLIITFLDFHNLSERILLSHVIVIFDSKGVTTLKVKVAQFFCSIKNSFLDFL